MGNSMDYILDMKKGGSLDNFIYSLGIIFIIVGVVVLLQIFEVFSLTTTQTWPLLVIGFGVVFFLGGILSYRKFLAFYTIPSVILIFFGLVFLLFSLDIITVSFVQFASRWWPVLLVLAGLSLISVFFSNRHFKNTAFRFEDVDDQTDYDDYESF